MDAPITEQLESLDLIAQRAFEREEREAARDLIRDCFAALPDDMQELYGEVVELHRARKFEESNAKFDEWMQRARELDLI